MKKKVSNRIILLMIGLSLIVSTVFAAQSVTSQVTVVEQNVTVNTSTGAVIKDAVLIVVTTVETKIDDVGNTKNETVIVNKIPVQAEKQVVTFNDIIKKAAEKSAEILKEIDNSSKSENEIQKKQEKIKKEAEQEFKKIVIQMVQEKQIELQDKNDTFMIEQMLPLTEVHDVILEDADGNIITDAKNVDVKIEVQSLVENMGEVRIMHYDVELEKWVIINPEVNFEAKTLKFHLENPGPIMVVYEPAKNVRGQYEPETV